MYNSGIVGGSRRRVLNMLNALRTRILARPSVYDMVHINEIFAHHSALYPHGPLHLPFYDTPKGCADETCRHAFVNRTMGYYWFV